MNAEQEWLALEAEHASLWSQCRYVGTLSPMPVACGLKFNNAPHAKSYGAKLYPMRVPAGAALFALTAAEKLVAGRPRTSLRAAGAHPDSYGAEYPLRGFGLEGSDPVRVWKPLAAEKALLEARPLVVRAALEVAA